MSLSFDVWFQNVVIRGSPVNLQYQIDAKTHAGVLVHLRPKSAPSDLLYLIIYDGHYGFTPNQVIAFIEKAFKHSAEHGCFCDVYWSIEELEEERSRSRSRDRTYGSRRAANNFVNQLINTTQMCAPALKLATKVGVQETVKGGVTIVAKKVPGVSLLCGGIFAAGRLWSGDLVGACLEVASGVASCVPGGGTAASIGIDALIAGKDLLKLRRRY